MTSWRSTYGTEYQTVTRSRSTSSLTDAGKRSTASRTTVTAGADERRHVQLEGRLVEVQSSDVRQSIGRRQVVGRGGEAHVRQRTAMRVHDALGATGRSRRVDDVRVVVRVDLANVRNRCRRRDRRATTTARPCTPPMRRRRPRRSRIERSLPSTGPRRRAAATVALRASVTSTLTPASASTDVTWSTGANGSSGTITAPARSTPWTATNDQTDFRR